MLFSFQLSKGLKKKLIKVSKEKGMSIAEIIRRALDKYLPTEEGEE